MKKESEALFKEPISSPTKTPAKESKVTPKKSTPVASGPKQSSLFNFVKKREEKKEEKTVGSSQKSSDKKT